MSEYQIGRLWSFWAQVGERPWLAKAACKGAGTELFYSTRKGPTGAAMRAAKACCDTCPVKQECLDYALDTGEKFGIWGGTSERQRRQIRRQRRLDAAA